MDIIDKAIATQEITDWLDKKKILPGQRETLKDQIEVITDALSQGIIVLNGLSFTHELLFPIENNDGKITVTQMVYGERMNDKILKPYQVGIKAQDTTGQFNALICALTKQPKGVIESLDSSDKRISVSIALFFT